MPKELEYCFDPEKHLYTVNGEAWPSVTQLLQEFGIIDFSNVPKDRLEFKRILGMRVHAATLLLDNGSLDDEHFRKNFPECVPYLEAYRKFREFEDFEPVHKEHRLFSKKWKFAGTPDEQGFHISKFGAHDALIDYKCTFSMYSATGPQLAGYSMLIEENLGIKIKKRFGLLLKPTGSYDLVPFKMADDFTDFQACVYLHWKKRTKYKKGV